MRSVGALYLVLFVAATILRVPIRVEGPEGVLERAALGDPTSKFVVDTWVTFGLALGVLGAALLIASRKPAGAQTLAWTVIGNELFCGIGSDVYKILRGYEMTAPAVWIVIHVVIILTGLWVVRRWDVAQVAAE